MVLGSCKGPASDKVIDYGAISEQSENRVNGKLSNVAVALGDQKEKSLFKLPISQEIVQPATA